MSGSLQPGCLISHYRVISPLGSGGMGEVYMARDESLERAVALKVLPSELTRSEDRVRRFVQEAKSASSLSHPNIVTIYEIGQAEPRTSEGVVQEGSVPLHFIAMELINGETLKDKIHREKCDLRTLLISLSQAAEGISKAHSAGIVHRDLKPENIMVSRDGFSKVLDFGLAKLLEERESADGLSDAVTSGPGRERTREGAVLGTAGYMSPEQVQGKGVDHRSDIFSFGCILYEAATRKKPFSAESPVETMHKILHDKPAPVEQLNPEAPAVLRRVIRRCLSKSPDRRFQSMKDLALELGEMAEEYDDLSISSEGSTTGSGSSGEAVALRRKGRPLLRAGAVAAVVIGLGGAGLGIFGLLHRPAAPVASENPFQSMRLEPLTSSGDLEASSLSPDGKYLANVRKQGGSYGLYVRQVATGSDVQVVPPLPTPFRGITFSPDENYLYYVNQETGGPGYSVLYEVPVLGGTVRKILFDVDTAVTFSPDGKRFALVRGYPDKGETALVVANADGSGEKDLAVLKQPERFALIGPSWSPDGKKILAGATRSRVTGLLELTMADADTGKLSPLGSARWLNLNGLAWLPDGSGVVVTAAQDQGGVNQQLWLVSYPSGAIRRVTNDLNRYAGISVTADSRILATTQQNQVSSLWLASPGVPGDPERIAPGSGKDETIFDLETGAGDRVFFAGRQNNGSYVGSMAGDGTQRTRLTPLPGRSSKPAVSGDGKVLAFTSMGEDRIPHVWKMDPDGGNPVQVTRGSGEGLLDISPDGRWILYVSPDDAGVYRSSLEGGKPVKLAAPLLGGSEFSPDGKRIVVETFLPGKDRLERCLVVLPAEGGKSLVTIPFPDGANVHWAPDGQALTYSKDEGGVSNIWRLPLDGSSPKPVTDFKSDLIFSYDWSRDGKRLYLCRGSETRDVVLIRDFR